MAYLSPAVPRFLLLLSLAGLTACTPKVLPPSDRIPLDPIAAALATPAAAQEAGVFAILLQNNPITPLATHQLSVSGHTLTILTFDSRAHSLQVLDNEDGPGTGASSSKSAAQSLNGIAAINGGFFTPEGAPLGLVFEKGRKYGGLITSSLGAGIYLHDPASRQAMLVRRSTWQKLYAKISPAHLLQSGPFLLENNAAVSGLSKSRPRERSFLLWDGFNGWAIGHCSSATLAQLGQVLATQPLPGFRIHHALNLDGGSSSDLWVSSSVKGGAISTRHLWNKDVRNYLVLTPVKP